jgi:asparaginyl-tRNA synthetase
MSSSAMSKCSNLPLRKKKAILSVRAKFLSEARQWLADNGFTEVQGPVIIPAIGRPLGSLEVSYFNKKALLSHGLQPYTDSFTKLFGKVYAIQPVFRAEKVKTNRHLVEFWRIELAASNMRFKDMITVVENLIGEVSDSLLSEASNELKLLGRNTDQLALIKSPFVRLTYDEAIERLQEKGINVQWGEELNWDLEKKLSLSHKNPFFIMDYPVSVENQFFKENPNKPELSLVADLLAPEGYGEMGSGGETGPKEEIRKKMEEDELDRDIQLWYLELKNSNQINSAFAVGIERYIQWFCGLTAISHATLFPRTFDSLYP